MLYSDASVLPRREPGVPRAARPSGNGTLRLSAAVLTLICHKPKCKLRGLTLIILKGDYVALLMIWIFESLITGACAVPLLPLLVDPNESLGGRKVAGLIEGLKPPPRAIRRRKP